MGIPWLDSEYVGVDEAGRGPLAGPVIAAVVGKVPSFIQVRDSKQLSPQKREKLCMQITTHCTWSIASASAEEIDRINIRQATLLAMKRALSVFPGEIKHVLIDGRDIPEIAWPCRAIVRGDQLVDAISAASIIAKVFRDHLMQSLETLYPVYGFAQHKGYPTQKHRTALQSHGPCILHRQSFL